MRSYFTKAWMVGVATALAVAVSSYKALAAEEEQKAAPYSNDACAFEDSASEKCVVGFECKNEDAELCNVVIEYLTTRKLLDTRLADQLALPGQARVCDDSPILCTCCDVKSGCYPCPKK